MINFIVSQLTKWPILIRVLIINNSGRRKAVTGAALPGICNIVCRFLCQLKHQVPYQFFIIQPLQTVKQPS